MLSRSRSGAGVAALALFGLVSAHAARSASGATDALPIAGAGSILTQPESAGLVSLRPFRERVPAGSTTEYVADFNGHVFQLLGERKVVAVLTPCASGSPGGIQVDHYQNLWVTCAAGTIEEFAPGATSPTREYDDKIDGVTYAPGSVAVDTAGDVWASSSGGTKCGSSGCKSYPGQISYWAAGSKNGAKPTGTVADANAVTPLNLDVDHAGSNVYLEYLTPTFQCAVDDISEAGIVTFDPAGNIGQCGGIYYSANGNVNVLDQDAAAITVFSASTLSAIGSFGPGSGDPIEFGFNADDSEIVAGDASFRSIDLGKNLSHKDGKWAAFANVDFSTPYDAKFSPSDK